MRVSASLICALCFLGACLHSDPFPKRSGRARHLAPDMQEATIDATDGAREALLSSASLSAASFFGEILGSQYAN